METSFPEIPNLKILRLIGSGATSRVYEAIDPATDHKVAVKVVPLLSPQDGDVRARAKREASILQSLRHANIVRLYRFHETDRDLVLELEYVDGCTLGEWSSRSRVFLIEPKLWILSQLAQALAIAHLEGTIHRDLKPDNVLVSKEGEVKLTDFGLAKSSADMMNGVTLPGVMIGSLSYMAPETLNNGASTYASDIFSFGVIAFELVTGHHPFPHTDVKSLMNTIDASTNAKLKLPYLDERLEAVLLNCLSVNPDDRPPSLWRVYAELMTAIEASGLYKECKALVSADAHKDGALEKAIQFKSNDLRSRINLTSKSAEPDKNKKLLRLINEFVFLFPEHGDTHYYVGLLNSKPRSNRRTLLIAASIVLVVSSIFASTQLRKTNVDVVAPTKVLEPKETDIKRDDTVERKIENKVSAQSLAAASGVLKMQISPDTRVFIDGIRYGANALKSLRLKAGIHHILVERENYLPIERSILIKKDSVTRIQTSEASR